MMTGIGDLSLIEPSVEDKRAAAARYFNQSAPKDLGNGTRLDSVQSIRGGMLYEFTLTELTSDEVNTADFRDIVYEASRLQTCEHDQLRALLESDDVFVEAVYRGSDGGIVTKFRIDKESCT